MSNSNFSNISNVSNPLGNLVISNDLFVGNNETINGNLDITKIFNASSTGTLSTGNTTFNLINTNATTVNFAGDATSLNIGNINNSETNLNGTVFFSQKYLNSPNQRFNCVLNTNGVYFIPSDDVNGLVASVTPDSGTVLTLIESGTAADVGGTNSHEKLGPSRKITVTHNAGDANDFIDVVGTDVYGDAQTETITLAATTKTHSTNHWSSISSLTFRTADGTGAASNSLEVGWVSTGETGYYTMGFKDSGVYVVDVVGSNVVHSLILQTLTFSNFIQWGFTMYQAVANTGSNDEWITTTGTDKIFGICQTAAVVIASDYTPTTQPASSAFVYDGTGAADSIQMDSDNGQNKVQPGAVVDIKAAYALSTNVNMFFVKVYSPAQGSDNSGASVFG